ncbi:MAG: arylamine N-acetyltransferase family protein, partial [Caulobacteraceae bacterium]
MNGIFGWALGELGFRVRRATGAVGAPGDHLVLRVELADGLYLADVGVCTGPLDPIPVREGGFSAGGFTYRVEALEGGRWRFHNDPLAFPPSFEFDLEAADESLLEGRCAELQTDPASHFVQNLMCARFVEGGMILLLGRNLLTITPAGRSDRLIGSEGEFAEVLADRLGLDVPEARGLWPRLCARHEEILAERAKKAELAPAAE